MKNEIIELKKGQNDLIRKDHDANGAIENSNKQIDAYYQSQIEKEWNFGEKLKNRSMFKVVSSLQKEMFKKSGEYRLRYYTKLLDATMVSLDEKIQAELMCISSQYRQTVAFSNFVEKIRFCLPYYLSISYVCNHISEGANRVKQPHPLNLFPKHDLFSCEYG